MYVYAIQEESFTTQIFMSFMGTKTIKWFDAMAPFAPTTPTQKDKRHKNRYIQRLTKNPI